MYQRCSVLLPPPPPSPPPPPLGLVLIYRPGEIKRLAGLERESNPYDTLLYKLDRSLRCYRTDHERRCNMSTELWNEWTTIESTVVTVNFVNSSMASMNRTHRYLSWDKPNVQVNNNWNCYILLLTVHYTALRFLTSYNLRHRPIAGHSRVSHCNQPRPITCRRITQARQIGSARLIRQKQIVALTSRWPRSTHMAFKSFFIDGFVVRPLTSTLPYPLRHRTNARTASSACCRPFAGLSHAGQNYRVNTSVLSDVRVLCLFHETERVHTPTLDRTPDTKVWTLLWTFCRAFSCQLSWGNALLKPSTFCSVSSNAELNYLPYPTENIT